MRLIIDVSEETYNKANTGLLGRLGLIIANGIPYNPSGDSISRDALKEVFNGYHSGIGSQPKFTLGACLQLIDNAPTVSDRYDEGYAQGYVDGSTGADMRGEEE